MRPCLGGASAPITLRAQSSRLRPPTAAHWVKEAGSASRRFNCFYSLSSLTCFPDPCSQPRERDLHPTHEAVPIWVFSFKSVGLLIGSRHSPPNFPAQTAGPASFLVPGLSPAPYLSLCQTPDVTFTLPHQSNYHINDESIYHLLSCYYVPGAVLKVFPTLSH